MFPAGLTHLKCDEERTWREVDNNNYLIAVEGGGGVERPGFAPPPETVLDGWKAGKDNRSDSNRARLSWKTKSNH
jgi:hypothetical protein